MAVFPNTTTIAAVVAGNGANTIDIPCPFWINPSDPTAIPEGWERTPDGRWTKKGADGYAATDVLNTSSPSPPPPVALAKDVPPPPPPSRQPPIPRAKAVSAPAVVGTNAPHQALSAPAVAGTVGPFPVCVTYNTLASISDATPGKTWQMMNIALKYYRDHWQNSSKNWVTPEEKFADLSEHEIWEIAAIDRRGAENYGWSLTEKVKFNLHKMLALPEVRKHALTDKDGNTWGVRTIGVGVIDGMYDHKRCRALTIHNVNPHPGQKMHEWSWILEREDGKRYRFRCNYKKSKQTFSCVEYPYGQAAPSMEPPSTGPGNDSKRAIDGKHYFRRAMALLHPEANDRGSGDWLVIDHHRSGPDVQDDSALMNMD